MKLALGQMQTIWEDKQANLKKLEHYLALIKEKKVDLFLLPETALTGFSMNTDQVKESEKESAGNVQRLAEAYGIAIGFGWVKDAGEKCENHYSILSPSGELLDYTKIHPFSYGGEAEFFRGGTKLPICEYQGFRIGVQICYDLRFPEPFQILSKEADLILVPANWPSRRREHWQCLLKARSIENMVYLAGVNCGGQIESMYYSGDSGLYAPDGAELKGEVLTMADAVPEEKILIYQIENDVKKYREHFPVKADRKEDLYRDL